eukprot:TRINITY_DN8263_c0_g1_i3.p1 TRINITY_DN8263_c0_g1~~TRINITY_DN8263_c0_g1_i3.p1  ORF type:complete len:580 (-),score=111.69 TRINITY_DN8263_c0_g1_i3:92-1831(-)
MVSKLTTWWLMRNWPEFSFPTTDNQDSSERTSIECGFLIDQYVPESFVRDDKAVFHLKADIGRRYDLFKQTMCQNHKLEESNFTVREIQNLPMDELFNFLPILLKCFRVGVLRALVKILTGKTYNHNKDLCVRRIMREFGNGYDENVSASLQKLEHILRNQDNIERSNFMISKCTSHSLIVALETILGELKRFPLQTIEAMYRKLRGKSAWVRSHQRKCTQRKGSLVEKVTNLAKKFLECVHSDDRLPRQLKNAFHVASLSARQICGEDGGLLQRLGPISPETIALQNDFLKAISLVKDLKQIDIMSIYCYLFPDDEPKGKSSLELQQPIQRFLTGWLFESCGGIVPEEIIHCVKEILKLSLGYKNIDIQERVSEEVESILNVSSHLQQIIYDCAEQTHLDILPLDSDLSEFEETYAPWFDDSDLNSAMFVEDQACYIGESLEPCDADNGKPFEGNSVNGNSQGKDSICHQKAHCSTKGAKRYRMQQIQDICDNVSTFAYHLIGSTVDALLKKKQITPDPATEHYLSPDMLVATDTTEMIPRNKNKSMDVLLLLNMAEKLLPQASRRVLKKARVALDVL